MTVIKLDLDFQYNDIPAVRRTIERLEPKLRYVMDCYNITTFTGSVSATARGYHVYLRTTSNISDYDIVAIQFFLGSDVWREFFNWQRVRMGTKNWNVLFKQKRKDGTVLSEETCLCAFVLSEQAPIAINMTRCHE
jgi:hypothetical protein